jgi:hypothetical protein
MKISRWRQLGEPPRPKSASRCRQAAVPPIAEHDSRASSSRDIRLAGYWPPRLPTQHRKRLCSNRHFGKVHHAPREWQPFTAEACVFGGVALQTRSGEAGCGTLFLANAIHVMVRDVGCQCQSSYFTTFLAKLPVNGRSLSNPTERCFTDANLDMIGNRETGSGVSLFLRDGGPLLIAAPTCLA